MRIVVVGAKGFPDAAGAGGVERCVFEQTRRLARRGHEVIVYARGRHGTRREADVTLRSVPFIDTKRLAGWSHALMAVVDTLLRLRDANVVHVHGAANGVFCLPLRLLGARVVFQVHGREWRAAKWGRLMRGLIKLSCRLGARTAYEVVTVCKPSLQALRAWAGGGGTKVHYVPNGVPTSLPVFTASRSSDSPFASEDPFLLYAGRIVPQKRIELLMRAALDLPQPMRLVLAGPMSHCSSYADELRRMAADSERVIWLGSVPFADLVELYRRSTAVVLPSDAEGCSCTLLEALTAGACIVTSDIDENLELLGSGGIAVPAGDGDALARTLRALVADPDRVQHMRKAALARSATLASWDDVEQRLNAVYSAGATVEPRAPQLAAEVGFTPES